MSASSGGRLRMPLILFAVVIAGLLVYLAMNRTDDRNRLPDATTSSDEVAGGARREATDREPRVGDADEETEAPAPTDARTDDCLRGEIVDHEGRPYAGAWVEIYARPILAAGETVDTSALDRRVAAARSDTNGRVEFARDVAVPVLVVAADDGRGLRASCRVEAGVSSFRLAFAAPRPLTIRVIDLAGKPVIDAEVGLSPIEDERPEAWTKVDATGATTLACGGDDVLDEFHLHARAPGRDHRAVEFRTADTLSLGEFTVVLCPASSVRCEIRSKADGRAIEGAELRVVDLGRSATRFFAEGRSDREGIARLGPLPTLEGVHAMDRSSSRPRTIHAVVAVSAPGFVTRRASVKLGEEATDTLTVELDEAVSVRGRTVDANGRPLRAEVFADPEVDADPRRFINASSGADGRFELIRPRAELAAGGPLRLVAAGLDPAGRFLQGTTVIEPPGRGPAVDLGDVVLDMVGPSGITEIATRIVDEDGAPIPGALLRAGSATTRADADGRAALRLLPPAEWPEFGAEAPGHLATTWLWYPNDEEFPPVVVLPRARRLHGRVLGRDGIAIAGADLTFRSEDDQTWVRTDAQGRYSLERVAATGLDVVYECGILHRHRDEIEAAVPDHAEEFDLTVDQDGADAALLVVEIEGPPTDLLGRLDVRLLRGASETNAPTAGTARVDTRGRAVFELLEAGPWRLAVVLESRTLHEEPCVVPPGRSTHRVRLAMKRPLRLGVSGPARGSTDVTYSLLDREGRVRRSVSERGDTWLEILPNADETAVRAVARSHDDRAWVGAGPVPLPPVDDLSAPLVEIPLRPSPLLQLVLPGEAAAIRLTPLGDTPADAVLAFPGEWDRLFALPRGRYALEYRLGDRRERHEIEVDRDLNVFTPPPLDEGH
ncbi:MAG: hypothetical protein R3F20_10500 [Planctomycetota bacterium]